MQHTEVAGWNVRECSVRLSRCDFSNRRSAARLEDGVPAAPHSFTSPADSYDAGHVQEYATVAEMIIKMEDDDEDIFTIQKRDMVRSSLSDDSVTDFIRFIKDENGFVVKKEDEDHEVIVKQELDIWPMVLQAPPAPRVQVAPDPRPSTSSGGGAASTPLLSFPPSPKSEAQDDHCEKGSMKRADADCRRALSERSDDCTGGEDTAVDGLRYECHYCQYITTRKSHLINHISQHVCEKLYKCKRCTYNAPYPSYLRKHMRIHTGEKPYSCERCEYRASQLGHLKTHMRTHTGEKPYACWQCKYRASRLCHLKEHMRSHTGEKPYACGQCEYRASRPGNLKEHMRSHTGEKPYACGQCKYRASRPGNLKTHMHTHTDEKPYKCEQCEFRASDRSSVKRHLRTRHNKVSVSTAK